MMATSQCYYEHEYIQPRLPPLHRRRRSTRNNVILFKRRKCSRDVQPVIQLSVM